MHIIATKYDGISQAYEGCVTNYMQGGLDIIWSWKANNYPNISLQENLWQREKTFLCYAFHPVGLHHTKAMFTLM